MCEFRAAAILGYIINSQILFFLISLVKFQFYVPVDIFQLLYFLIFCLEMFRAALRYISLVDFQIGFRILFQNLKFSVKPIAGRIKY